MIWRPPCTSGTSILVAAGTLALGGSAYRHALLGAQMNCAVNAESAWMLFQSATASAPRTILPEKVSSFATSSPTENPCPHPMRPLDASSN